MKWLRVSSKVSIAGCVIGLLSLLPAWYTLRPNRIVNGNGLSLWGAAGWGATFAFLVLWLICLLLSITGSPENKKNTIFLGLTLNAIAVLAIVISGTASGNLLNGEPAAARFSLSGGFWISLLGVYIAIYFCRHKLRDDILLQNLVSWPAIIIAVVLTALGFFKHISVMVEYSQNRDIFTRELLTHLFIFSVSAAAGTIIGIPLGIWATRSRIAEKPIFFITNILQTVPSLVLFGLLIAPLSALTISVPALRNWGISGIGATPAIIALIIYSLLPVARNTYTGIKQIDPVVLDSGRGMGMSRFQLFYKIEVPLSAPLVLEGMRTASVQAVGNTAVAALIGAGGLGVFIFTGISQTAGDLVILGAIPIMLLAVLVDNILRLCVLAATPKGLRTS